MEFFKSDSRIGFMTSRKLAYGLSIFLFVASITALFTRGLTLSLEFEGGSTWAVESQDFTRSQAESVLNEFDAAEGAKFQAATTADGTRILRITSQVDDVNTGSEVANALAEAAGLEPGDVTFTGNELFINVESLRYDRNTFARIDLLVEGNLPPVPEPGTWALMLGGLLLPALARRARARRGA
jgi:preprotein translocase subunit SecF